MRKITHVGHTQFARISRVQSAESISQFPLKKFSQRFTKFKHQLEKFNEIFLRQFITDGVVRIPYGCHAVLQAQILHADLLLQDLKQFNAAS